MAEYEGPEVTDNPFKDDEEYPEDTTDYLADASDEVKREQQIVAQRRQQDEVIASIKVTPSLSSDINEPATRETSADDYVDAVAAKNAEQSTLELKSFAIQTVTIAEQFESFDDLLSQAKELYSWLAEEDAQGAQDGPAGADLG